MIISTAPQRVTHQNVKEFRAREATRGRLIKKRPRILAQRSNGIKFGQTNAKSTMNKNNERVYRMAFGSVYPHYVNKVERKGRTREEVDEVICWLTGYDKKTLKKIIDDKTDLETFFAKAPQLHPNASKITGVICGYRIEEIEDKLMQKIRYMDKLVDELAKGRAMEKILRK